jgi:hypothetical protein
LQSDAGRDFPGTPPSIRIDDPVGNDLDVIGDNEYVGWYVHAPEDADSVDWVSDYGKPLIISEFGADALFGYHGDEATRWQKNGHSGSGLPLMPLTCPIAFDQV